MRIGPYAIEQDYSHYVARAAKTVLAVVGTAHNGPIGVPTLCTSAQDLVNKFGPHRVDTKNGIYNYGLYAAQYFLSQSSKVYFVRAAHTENRKTDPTTGAFVTDTDGAYILDGTEIAKEATADIKGQGTGTIEDAITLAAVNKGTYSNNYSIYLTKIETTKVVSGDETTITQTVSAPIRNTRGLFVVTETTTSSKRAKQLDEEEGTTTSYTYNILVKNLLDNVLEEIKGVSLEDLDTNYTAKYIRVSKVNTTTPAATLDAGVYLLKGGNDGDKDVSPGDYIQALSTLSSENIDMNLFAIPETHDSSVIVAALSLAETRGDCLFLVDPPKNLTKEEVIKWHNGVSSSYTIEKLNSSYGALYYDWVTIYDSLNKIKVDVPPSVVVAATIAYSDRTSEVWYAPAGLTRGVVRGVIESKTKLSRVDTEQLYESENAINSLYDDPQVGLVLWGQKTLLRANSALNRINTRRLMNYLKRVVVAACTYLTFEPNDRITWNSFEMKITPILESVKKKRGIYEYRIVKGEEIVTDNDIDNYRMPCMILIRPTKAAEEIPIYFALTSTGADFNEVLDESGVIVE